MNADFLPLNRLSETIIGSVFRVMNGLGAGFLERVYQNALAHELRKTGLEVAQQQIIMVHYDDVPVGTYSADLLVENAVLVELKAVKALDNTHAAQCINYLKATALRLCLLLNFGNRAWKSSASPTAPDRQKKEPRSGTNDLRASMVNIS
ncbi:MAG: GxxExxY protein [Rhodopila sp.]